MAFAGDGEQARFAPESECLFRCGENCLFRIEHNLSDVARSSQVKRSLPAIGEHFSDKYEGVRLRLGIHGNRGYQVIGCVLLYDHARNCRRPRSFSNADFSGFEFWYRGAFDPTFEEPVQFAALLVPEWTWQFLFETLHKLLGGDALSGA